MPGIQSRNINLSAAADFLGTGAIEVPIFETEIMDVVRRSSIALSRIKSIPATGHPHRYFEQTAIATGAAVDPRNLSATPSGPTRVERPAFIKATTAQTNLSLFDQDVTEQQGQFAYVVAKDVDDVISAIEINRANMLWSGTDTSLTTPTTLEWMGGLTQITNTLVVAPKTSIIDAIKTKVASMVGNKMYRVRPTAIYTNSVTADLIDKEAKASRITLDPVEVAAGVTVSSINTQAGKLPIIADEFMPANVTGAAYGFAAPPAGYQNFFLAIITEAYVELPVVSGKEFNPNPRLFQLGLVGNLQGQFVGVKFDAIIFKGASYAHAVLCIQA